MKHASSRAAVLALSLVSMVAALSAAGAGETPGAGGRAQLRIGVVGGTGTIGQRIVREALQRGHHVTLIARDPANGRAAIAWARIGSSSTARAKAASPWRTLRSRCSTRRRIRGTSGSDSRWATEVSPPTRCGRETRK